MSEQRLELWSTPFVQEHMTRALQQGLEWYEQSMRESMGDTFRSNLQFVPLENSLEAAFLVWWLVVADARDYYHEVNLLAQHEVTVDNRTVRLDFVIVPQDSELFLRAERNGLSIQRVGVELDDQDAHEPTNEQVTSRNQLDRVLQLTGWLIFHISRSDFDRDPVASVNAVYMAAITAFWDLRHRMWAIDRERRNIRPFPGPQASDDEAFQDPE